MRKARQEVMANRSDRDPPSLHDVQGRQARHGNEARIGSSHQGQRAQKPAQKAGYKTATCIPVPTNRSLHQPRRPYKMSCFVMIRMRVAHNLLSLRACSRRFGPGFRVFRPISPALRLRHGSLLSIPLRSVHPVAGSLAAAGPFFARIARGRGRPLAPARFVRLIAPVRARARRARTQGALVPSASQGSFRAGANRERKQPRADTASFLVSHYREESPGVKVFLELFHKLRTNSRCRQTGSRSGAIPNRSLSSPPLPPAAPRPKR